MAQATLYQRYSSYFQRASALYQRPQIKASLEIIMSVFAVTLLTLLAIRPTVTNIATLQKKIEDQEVVLKKADVKLAQLIKAEGQLSEYRGQLQFFSDAVPGSFDYFNIAKRIEIVARNNGLTVSTMRLPGSIFYGGSVIEGLTADKAKGVVVPDTDGVTTIGVSFAVSGSQSQVFGFLKEIENMDMLAVIQNINIGKILLTSKQQTSGLDINGEAWFYSFNSPTK